MSEMTNLQRHALGLLYPLADALQMKLYLMCRKDLPMEVVGSQPIEIPFSKDFVVDTKVKVFASGFILDNTKEPQSVWVLLRAKGDLWMYAKFYREHSEVYFGIVDGAKVGLNEVSAPLFQAMKPEQRKADLAKGVVAEFVRFKDDTEWRVHGKPDTVDQGQARPPEVLSGDADSTAGVATA